MKDVPLSVRQFSRAVAFDDMTIRSDGDGRTVEGYAAAFNVPAEIRDQDGHYNEVLARTSFDNTIKIRGTNFGVFYNHARTIYGTPDGALSVPIGVALEVSTDERGVFTATRYLDNPLADSVLDGIKQRAIRGQSFSGKFMASTRSKTNKRGELPTITRTEVAMREYGPTVFPAYTEAAILGTRSVSNFLDELASIDPEDLDRFRHMLGITATAADAVRDTSNAEAVPQSIAVEPLTHSARQKKLTFAREARDRNLL